MARLTSLLRHLQWSPCWRPVGLWWRRNTLSTAIRMTGGQNSPSSSGLANSGSSTRHRLKTKQRSSSPWHHWSRFYKITIWLSSMCCIKMDWAGVFFFFFKRDGSDKPYLHSLYFISIFPNVKNCSWSFFFSLGSPKEGAHSPRVSSWQPAGHAGQTDLLVHLQAKKLGRSHPSLLSQRDGGTSHEQVG